MVQHIEATGRYKMRVATHSSEMNQDPIMRSTGKLVADTCHDATPNSD